MKPRVLVLAGLLLVPGALTAADEIWEKKQASEWTEKECEKILATSPWVRRDATLLPKQQSPGQVGARSAGSGDFEGSGRGSSAASPDAERNLGLPNMVYFRWQSSRIIRQAMARKLLLEEAITEDQARQFVNSPAMEKSLVISVSADTHAPLLRLVRGKEESIRAQSYLEKKNKEKISVERVIGMDPQKGSTDVLLVFPRETGGQPTLSAEDREVELVLFIGDRKVRQKFRLDKMLVEGRLDV